MNLLDSKLYTIFRTLSETELKELDKAVHSPFFNYRIEEVRLFEYLLKQHKLKRGNFLAENAILFVFKKKKGLADLRHVMTYLLRIITRFIAINELDKSPHLNNLLLLTSYRKRGLEKPFLNTYIETEKLFSQKTKLAAELYFYQLQLHLEYYNYSIVNRKAANSNLITLSEDLDTFYTIQKLKQSCTILSYQNIFKFNHQPSFLAEVLVMAEQEKFFKNPLVKLLYYNYKCLKEPQTETHFKELKKTLLSDNSKRIDIKELRDIYTLAINFCIKMLNTGTENYYKEVFDIYQSGLNNEIFIENRKISPFTYKNISAVAIRLKQYEWARTFIETYKPFITKDNQEGFYSYCIARYYFAIKNYSPISDLLLDLEIKEQFTDLDARILLSKTYFETDKIHLLNYCIANLKQQLKRKKLQSYHKAVYGNFVKIISKILNLSTYDTKGKRALLETINTTKELAEREWLISKLN